MSFQNYLPDTAVELVNLLGLIPHPEGGFFLETFRSGSVPMASRGQTDRTAPPECLVTLTPDHRALKYNNSSSSASVGVGTAGAVVQYQRNCLTSVYWVPTVASPTLPLLVNQSDHVHYYQGGHAFCYHIYNPATRALRTEVLGPDFRTGQALQVCVHGGEWKCGTLQPLAGLSSSSSVDYGIVSEAVAPGFDFHDMTFVTAAQLTQEGTSSSPSVEELLRPFLQRPATVDAKNEDFDSHYDQNEAQNSRSK